MKIPKIGASSLAVTLVAALMLGGAETASATNELPTSNESITAQPEVRLDADDLDASDKTPTTEDAAVSEVEAQEEDVNRDPETSQEAQEGAGSPLTLPLPRDRAMSGTLTLPAGFPESLKAQIRVIAHWNPSYMNQGEECGASGRQSGIFDPVTGDWSVIGLGPCYHSVSYALEPSVETNGWGFDSADGAIDSISYDLAIGDATGINESMTTVGALRIPGRFEVVYRSANKVAALPPFHGITAIDTQTGKETVPVIIDSDYVGATTFGFTTLTLPPGTYVLRVQSNDTSKTLWFDGSANGTLNANEAIELTVRPWWGENIGGTYLFDLTPPTSPEPENPPSVATSNAVGTLANTGSSDGFLGSAAIMVFALLLAGAGSVVYGRRGTATKA